MNACAPHPAPTPLLQQAELALGQWIDPYLGCDLLSADAVRSLDATDGQLRLAIQLGFPAEGYRQVLAEQLRSHLLAQTDAEAVEIQVAWTVEAAPATVQALPAVKQLIAVASGKGGWASPPPRPIWPWHWPPTAHGSACSMPISTVPASRDCSAYLACRRAATASYSPCSAMACSACRLVFWSTRKPR